ncbi:MAG: hypothetical protein DWH96_04595 [Planctomycetota bacterium]|nr:MAG: hypothetical protein DWH96_04595 [Planctomycetota bacterium]
MRPCATCSRLCQVITQVASRCRHFALRMFALRSERSSLNSVVLKAIHAPIEREILRVRTLRVFDNCSGIAMQRQRENFASLRTPQISISFGTTQVQTRRSASSSSWNAQIRFARRKKLRGGTHKACVLSAWRAPLGVVLLMECADPIRTPEEAAWWYAQGVRVVGMAWGRGSRYCGGNAMAGGINSMGRALVEAFDDLGILHDASHLSRAAFDDLLNITDQRIVATHSNAAALMPHSERHLTDVQLAAIASRDGVVGLNLYGKFLAANRPATLNDCLAHLERVTEFATSQRIALGSDFDGGFTRHDVPQEIGGPHGLSILSNALKTRGFSTAEVLGFQHNNWLRVLRSALPVA